MTEIPRRFKLVRKEDESGVSGTGEIAHGVTFANGRTILCWLTDLREDGPDASSVGVYDSVEDMIDIHGHDGKTVIEWIDD